MLASKERLRKVVAEMKEMMYQKDKFPSVMWEQRYAFLTRLSNRLQNEIKEGNNAQVMEEIRVLRQQQWEEYQEKMERDRQNHEYNERIRKARRGRG